MWMQLIEANHLDKTDRASRRNPTLSWSNASAGTLNGSRT